tara:strand:+ start:46 stop:663 length:618 start_codon:yes stop_codon:yes gene_type:complete
MFEHLKCANDEDVRYSYEDIVEEANKYNRGDAPDIPLVPRSTYKDSVPYTRKLNYHMLQKFNCGYDDPNEPVIMKGAWEVMALNYSARIHFNEVVRERFLRFYKATILSDRDAGLWKEKLDTLMHKDKWKRHLYSQSTSEGNWTQMSLLYQKRFNMIWIFGIKYMLTDDQLKIVKSIYRHIKKLTTLTNPNEEKDKWQQLIQQAI